MKEKKDGKGVMVGLICSEIKILEELIGDRLLRFVLEVPRKSGEVDRLPCIVKESVVKEFGVEQYQTVKVIGEVQTVNRGNKLKTYFYVNEFGDFSNLEIGRNKIEFTGHICRENTSLRKARSGWAILSSVLATNHEHRSASYIPCVFWGQDAHDVSTMGVGSEIRVYGRFQSRIYPKTLKNGKVIDMSTYEVSVKDFKILKYEEVQE